jgi:hypothetical protein
MQVNNVTVPDAGTTTEVIIDNVGGWAYIVTTTVAVQQQNLNDYQASLQTTIDEATTQIAALQETVSTAQDSLSSVSAALAAPAPGPSLETASPSMSTASEASSTPQ